MESGETIKIKRNASRRSLLLSSALTAEVVRSQGSAVKKINKKIYSANTHTVEVNWLHVTFDLEHKNE